MATKIVGYNIETTSDPIVDQFKANTHAETPLFRLLTAVGNPTDTSNRLTGTNATGTNSGSNNIRISTGKSTGTGIGGDIIFEISSAGTAGSTLNSFSEVTKISLENSLFSIGNLSFAIATDKFTVDRTTGNASVYGNLGVGGNLTITGDLTVSGTTTTIDTTNLLVEDAEVVIGNVTSPTDSTANSGGIRLKGATDKLIQWYSATESWTSSEHFNLVTGKSYKISGTDVLTSTQILGRTPGGTTAGDIVTIDASQTLTNKTLTTPDVNGGTVDSLTSFSLRDTSAAFDVSVISTSSTALTAGRSLTFDVTNSSRSVKLGGNIDIANNFTTSGNNAITFTTTTATSVTLPSVGTGTLIGTNDTGTITNSMIANTTIANDKLVNSSVTINGVSVALGGTGTITAAIQVPLSNYASFGGSNSVGQVGQISTNLTAGNDIVLTGLLNDGVSSYTIVVYDAP